MRSIWLVSALLFSVTLNAKPLYVQMSEAMILKMSDGEEYVVRTAAHLMTSRTKTHLIVNDRTVDSKTRPQNSRFRLVFEDKGMEISARCGLKDVRLLGSVNEVYADNVSMKRNLSDVERKYMTPMRCEIKVDGERVGELVADKLMTLES